MFAGLCLQIWYDVFSKVLMLLCQFWSCGTVGWQEFIDNEGGPDTDATRSKLRKKMNFDKELKDPEFPDCYLTMFNLKPSSRVIPCFFRGMAFDFWDFLFVGTKAGFLVYSFENSGFTWLGCLLTHLQANHHFLQYIFSLEKGPPYLFVTLWLECWVRICLNYLYDIHM